MKEEKFYWRIEEKIMSDNDPVYGRHKYENKCKVSFTFECLAPDNVTSCRFWSGTVDSCNNWELDHNVPKGKAPVKRCKLKYANKWAIIRKLKDYYGEDVIKDVQEMEKEGK